MSGYLIIKAVWDSNNRNHDNCSSKV